MSDDMEYESEFDLPKKIRESLLKIPTPNDGYYYKSLRVKRLNHLAIFIGELNFCFDDRECYLTVRSSDQGGEEWRVTGSSILDLLEMDPLTNSSFKRSDEISMQMDMSKKTKEERIFTECYFFLCTAMTLTDEEIEGLNKRIHQSYRRYFPAEK